MVELSFPLQDTTAFLTSLAQAQDITFAEEFHEKYFFFPAKEGHELLLKVSDEGHALQGLTDTPEGTEIIHFPLPASFSNIKEILETTLGLLGELEVRQTAYELKGCTFTICKLNNRAFVLRLQGYSKAQLKEQARILGFSPDSHLKESFLSYTQKLEGETLS